MITAQQEVTYAIHRLAIAIETEHEGFKRATERARNLYRLKQQRETTVLLSQLAYQPPLPTSEVCDPDMYSTGECSYMEDGTEEYE